MLGGGRRTHYKKCDVYKWWPHPLPELQYREMKICDHVMKRKQYTQQRADQEGAACFTS